MITRQSRHRRPRLFCWQSGVTAPSPQIRDRDPFSVCGTYPALPEPRGDERFRVAQDDESLAGEVPKLVAEEARREVGDALRRFLTAFGEFDCERQRYLSRLE
jgi:hypothetical protein